LLEAGRRRVNHGPRSGGGVRQQRPTLPVLSITGYFAGAARRSELLGAGMDMISKPFTVETIARKVREMIAD
jgi:hypothetical protein